MTPQRMMELVRSLAAVHDKLCTVGRGDHAATVREAQAGLRYAANEIELLRKHVEDLARIVNRGGT